MGQMLNRLQVTGFKYIFPDLATRRNPFHVNMIQRQLTKHMSVAFGEMHEELSMAFKELLPEDETGQGQMLLWRVLLTQRYL